MEALPRKKELILSCVNNLKHESISKIFNISIPYIYRLQNEANLKSIRYINSHRIKRKKKIIYVKHTFIRDIILSYFDITLEELKGTLRNRKYVIPRMFLIHYLIEKTPLNWSALSKEIGKNHTSAIFYSKKMNREMIYPDTQSIKKELDILMKHV